MKTIDEYALDLVADGAQSIVEDDMNENEEIADADHEAARQRAYQIIDAIRAFPLIVLGLADQNADDVKAEAAE